MNLRNLSTVVRNRRWFVIGVVFFALLCIPKLLLIIRPTYTASAEITYVGNSGDAVVLPADLPELAVSSRVINRAINNGHLNLGPDQILSRISVREAPHSDIIPVTFRSKDESAAVATANAVADAVVVEYKRLATQQYDEVIDKLSAQAADLGKRIERFDDLYQQSVRGDSLAAATNGIDSLGSRLETVDQARVEAHAKLAQDLAAYATQSDGASSSSVRSVVREETLAHDPVLAALSAQEAKDRTSYEEMRAGYTDSFPGLAGLHEKVSIESSAVDQEAQGAATAHRGSSPTYAQMLLAQQTAESAISGDRARVQSMESEYDSLRTRLQALPKQTVPADHFRVQRDGAEASYTQVEGRLNTAIADRETAESLNTIVILDHASSAAPSTSPLVTSVVIVLLIAALAIGAAFLAEMLDPRIRTRSDVEGLYGSPLIGSL